MPEPTAVDAAVKVAEERIAALGMMLDKRFVKIEKKAAELEKKIGELAARPAGGDGAAAAPDPRVDDLVGRLDAIEGRLDVLASKSSGGPAPASGPDPRIDAIEKKLETLDSRPPAESGGPSESDYEGLLDRIAALESRLETSPGADSGGVEARLVALEAKVDAMSWRSEGGLETRIAALESKLAQGGGGGGAPAAAPSGDAPASGKVEAIEKKVEALLKLAAKVADVESRLEMLANSPIERGESAPAAAAPFKPTPTELKELTLALTQTAEWKGLMDGQFRMMMKHLEGEVIPRVVKKNLEAK